MNRPTILQQALATLNLSNINVSRKVVLDAFNNALQPTFTNGKLITPDLDTHKALTDAKRLLLKFIETASFPFRCANCYCKDNFDPTLYVEVDNVLLCHTCQKGLLSILDANPDFKTAAQLTREEEARAKEESLQAAWRKRMEERELI